MTTRRDDEGADGRRSGWALVLGTVTLLAPVAVVGGIGLQHRAGATHAAAVAAPALRPPLDEGPPYLGDRSEDHPEPRPTPAPHCTRADASFVVTATVSTVEVVFRRISERDCALPQDCNIAYDVEDASGREVAHAGAGVCEPVYLAGSSGDEDRATELSGCLPAGEYRVRASYTPEWHGETTLHVPAGIDACGP